MEQHLAHFRDKRARGEKLSVGVYGLTGCAGCQLTLLFERERFLDLLDKVDLKAIPFIKGKNYEGRFDLVIVEGLVASEEDAAAVERLRSRCDVLLALGACAVHGCVPAMKNFMDARDVERRSYAKVDFLSLVDPTPISRHVHVDVELPGCPPDAEQLYEALGDLILGRPPRIVQSPVCVECTKRGVDCLLRKNKPCLGSITVGGCRAVCTAAGHACMGCRGPTKDANFLAFTNLLEKKGYRREDIERRLRTYAGLLVEERLKEKEAAKALAPEAKA